MVQEIVVFNGKVFNRDMLNPIASVDELLALRKSIDDTLAASIPIEINLQAKYFVFYSMARQAALKKSGGIFVYVMIDHRTGLSKIGSSNNPRYREKTLQSDNPIIDIVFFHPSGRDVEKALHKKYDSKRIRGEWFSLSQEDVIELREFVAAPVEKEFKRLLDQYKEGSSIPFNGDNFLDCITNAMQMIDKMERNANEPNA